MSEQSDKSDALWSKLLTNAYGEPVEAAPAFRSSLLTSLKQKTACNGGVREDDAQWEKLLTRTYAPCTPRNEFKTTLLAALKTRQAEVEFSETLLEESNSENAAESPAMLDDSRWQKLLTAAYIPCEPRVEFRTTLLSSLKAKQQENATGAEQADPVERLLASSYESIVPRRGFETRLLENLRERQRNTNAKRLQTRRRTIFLSSLSSLAAAAMVIFVVGVLPVSDYFKFNFGQKPVMLQSAADLPVVIPLEAMRSELQAAEAASVEYSVRELPEMVVQPLQPILPAASGMAGAAVVAASAISVDRGRIGSLYDASLPQTVRGIGMEVKEGDTWRQMDETQLAEVRAGMAFRPAAGTGRPGLGFGNGATIHVLPDTVINVTDQGINLREGFMTVQVPETADNGFPLHFAERDISIQPGTMLVASVESPDNYAVGGAPAPLVMVDNGGLALAKGESGYGPLLANQIYEINNYVTPDLPGRPACATECAQLEAQMAPFGIQLASSGDFGAAPRIATGPTQLRIAERTPEGFEKSGTKWVATGYDGGLTEKIKYLSEEYFAFANKRRDLANALALGAEVVLDGGDGTYYEIYK